MAKSSKTKPNGNSTKPSDKKNKVSLKRKYQATAKQVGDLPPPDPLPLPCTCCFCADAEGGSLVLCEDGTCFILPPPTVLSVLTFDPNRPGGMPFWAPV